MKNRAFTLAEVLITIGIIGVVAAMTLPSLINNSQKKELEAGLKKNYSVIQQALMMYQAQNGEKLQGNVLAKHELKPIIIKYFDVLIDCGYGSGDPNEACVPMYEIDNQNYHAYYKTYNNLAMRFALLDDGQFILKDGSTVFIENAGESLSLITVDVNGFIKNPNRWGHDLFTFQLMADGRLLPMGADGTTFSNETIYCSVNSNNIYNGVGCTNKALTEKDYWQNLPK